VKPYDGDVEGKPVELPAFGSKGHVQSLSCASDSPDSGVVVGFRLILEQPFALSPPAPYPDPAYFAWMAPGSVYANEIDWTYEDAHFSNFYPAARLQRNTGAGENCEQCAIVRHFVKSPMGPAGTMSGTILSVTSLSGAILAGC
jgi:hypothetical protein